MRNKHVKETTERVIACIDLGTNSARLLIVQLYANFSYRILRQHKITVRLGEGEFVSGYLTDAAMDRAIVACRGFYEIALSFGAVEVIGYATSATRDAKNREVFLERLLKETGIDFDVISGNEEARLIWLGITSSTEIIENSVLFIDIGGGSTEIIVGDQHGYSFLYSLHLGSIRTTTQFFSNPKGSIPQSELKALRKHIVGEVASVSSEIKQYAPTIAIGSSGTVINLEKVASKIETTHQQGILTRKELKALYLLLAGLSYSERCAIPGINKERCDIIVAGARILYEVMKACNIREIKVTEFGLRDGMLADYLARCPEFLERGDLSVRDVSIHQLAQIFCVDLAHASHVSDLTAQMFDSAHASGLISYDTRWRELLLYASYVHDVGQFIAHFRHQLHSEYIVSNAGLLGFSEYEILLLSLFCRYHRKRIPRERDIGYSSLSTEDKRAVFILSFILRCAEALDRSHDGRVKTAVLSRPNERKIQLQVTATQDCTIEMWAVEEEISLLENTFAYEVNIVCTTQ
ncbi:MAG: Ppx/GppA family phosphatase [Methanomicrobiales archaeon]|jgi:exopolyphosphatase/guanosine-5'-triphosphate,3'-diphosphate pyrophosphatase|nr:Ppx/GppA family phosphatase [Methanomicrobiales archaeon]